jgi:hypothetical protein
MAPPNDPNVELSGTERSPQLEPEVHPALHIIVEHRLNTRPRKCLGFLSLRESELEAALVGTRRDLERGDSVQESVEAHVQRITSA